MINEKQVLALVRLELPQKLSKDIFILHETKEYIVKSIKLLPIIYRIPLLIALNSLNIFPIFFRAKKFENLDQKSQIFIWFQISKLPLFSSLKKFVRVLALIRSFDFYTN